GADRQPVVAAGRQVVPDAGHGVAELLRRENVPALLRPADDGPVLDLGVVRRPGRAGEDAAGDNVRGAGGLAGAEEGGGLGGLALAHVESTPADLAGVRLELDRPGAEQRPFAVPEVLHDGVIDHQLAVEVDGGAGADLEDAEAVPLAEGAVG